jgi:4-amino-4-deoxy-L-arabinose transferase-like glycosyltransferase
VNVRLAVAAIVLVALAAIVHTWTIFSQTIDEPAHVAAGAEWLSGTYELDPQHPPLARILVAIGPILRGAHYERLSHWMYSGNAILYGAGDYLATLASARAGTLPFFLLGCWVVFAWTRRLFGDAAGVIALFFFALQPTVLAHAGLATTDMAAAATIIAALYAFARWQEEPSVARAAILGVAIAAAVASKFSAIVFLAAGGAALLAAGRARAGSPRPLVQLLVALAVAIAGILAIYRFDAGAFLRGIEDLRAHNKVGHPSYLFGEVRREGWRFYFPIALWFKTTLPLLVAFAFGIRKRTAALVAIFLAILAVAMLSRISIGVRHVLPLYPLMAMIAAYGVIQLRRPFAIAILVAQVATFALAHPDHLPYFNLTAGRDPSRILLDSNLDWGQDLLRLEEACERRSIDALNIAYFGSADVRRHRLPKLTPLRPFTPTKGWVAISEMNLKDLGARNRPRGAFDWLRQYEPVERVGKSIVLYRVP